LASHGCEIFKVTDAGMGKPRAQMCLKAVVGIKVLQNVSEVILNRPPIKRGDWVRFNSNSSLRRRVTAVSMGSIYFDQEESVGGVLVPAFSAARSKFWVPVAEPENFQPAGAELRAEVHDLRIRLKEALREKGSLEVERKNLTRSCDTAIINAEKLRTALQEAVKERTALEADVEAFRFNLRDAKALLNAAKKEAKLALDLYEAAIDDRNTERFKKERARDQIHRLEAEFLALRRQLGAPGPNKIMM